MGAGAVAYLLYSSMKASDDDTQKFLQYLAATEAETIRSWKKKSDMRQTALHHQRISLRSFYIQRRAARLQHCRCVHERPKRCDGA